MNSALAEQAEKARSLSADIDSAVLKINRAQRQQDVDYAAQALMQMGNVHETRELLQEKLSSAVLYRHKDMTPLYALSALFSLYGHIDASTLGNLLVFSPFVEHSMVGNYGRLQVLYTAFRVGHFEQAEEAMISMLDFRRGSLESHFHALWTYGCILGTLNTDLSRFRQERNLANDGIRLATLLGDQVKFERSYFSWLNAQSQLSPHGQEDLFAAMRQKRQKGDSNLNFAVQQLLLLYSARDACERGELKQACSQLHAAREEETVSPTIVRAFFLLEQARLAQCQDNQKRARDYIAEANHYIELYPNTLNFRVLEELNQRLQTPFTLNPEGVVRSARLLESVQRLSVEYKRSWRVMSLRRYFCFNRASRHKRQPSP